MRGKTAFLPSCDSDNLQLAYRRITYMRARSHLRLPSLLFVLFWVYVFSNTPACRFRFVVRLSQFVYLRGRCITTGTDKYSGWKFGVW
jgi:hypothetical protein